MTVLSLLASTALILFAIRFLRKGIDRLIELRMQTVIALLRGTSTRSFLAGTALAALAPSSSAMSVVASRIIGEERISSHAALALLIGINIGITSLVIMGSAGIDAWYPLFLVPGVALFQLSSRETLRGIGQVAISLGFIFLGLQLFRQNIPLLMNGETVVIMGVVTKHEIILAVLAACISFCMQSGTAAILLFACLADSMPLPLTAIFAVVGGANIGPVATTLLLSWSNRNSRLPVIAYAMIKIIAIIACTTIPLLGAAWASSFDSGGYGAAKCHVLIALATAVIGLTCGQWFLRLAASINGDGSDDALRDGAPRLAWMRFSADDDGSTRLLFASRMELIRTSGVVREMLQLLWISWTTGRMSLAKTAAKLDDRIDAFDRVIQGRLISMKPADRGNGQEHPHGREQLRQLRYVAHLESLGDVIERQLCGLVVKAIPHRESLPAECHAVLDDAYNALQHALLTLDGALVNGNATSTASIAQQVDTVRIAYQRELGRTLLRRGNGLHHEANAVYMDILLHMARLGDGIVEAAIALCDGDMPASTSASTAPCPTISIGA